MAALGADRRPGGRGRADRRALRRCRRCATSGRPTGRATGKPRGVVRRAHGAPLPRARGDLRRAAARGRRARGRQRDDAHRRAPDRRSTRGARCCSSSTRSSRDPLRLYRDTMHAPIVGRGRAARADAGRARRGRGASSPRFTAADRPIRDVPRGDASRRRSCATSPATSRSARPQDRDNEYLRPHRFVTNVVRERARAAAARRLYAPLDAATPVRLLPAARGRRLQDQARDPALLRPGVDHRAGRRRAAARLRPRAQGAPDVDRAQPARAAAAARADRRTCASSRRTRARTS